MLTLKFSKIHLIDKKAAKAWEPIIVSPQKSFARPLASSGGVASHGGLCCYRMLKTTSFHLPCNDFWLSGEDINRKATAWPELWGGGSDPRSWQCWLCQKLPIYLMCCVHFLTTNLTSSQMSSFARGFHFLWGVDSFRKLSSLITSLSPRHKMQPNLMSPFLI